jgi:hypothetical protein
MISRALLRASAIGSVNLVEAAALDSLFATSRGRMWGLLRFSGRYAELGFVKVKGREVYLSPMNTAVAVHRSEATRFDRRQL